MGIRKCLVDGCGAKETTTPGRAFFRIPQYEPRKSAWLKQLRLPKGASIVGKSSMVCSRHFEKRFIRRYEDGSRHLSRDAIPTIFSKVSSSEDEVEQESESPPPPEVPLPGSSVEDPPQLSPPPPKFIRLAPSDAAVEAGLNAASDGPMPTVSAGAVDPLPQNETKRKSGKNTNTDLSNPISSESVQIPTPQSAPKRRPKLIEEIEKLIRDTQVEKVQGDGVKTLRNRTVSVKKGPCQSRRKEKEFPEPGEERGENCDHGIASGRATPPESRDKYQWKLKYLDLRKKKIKSKLTVLNAIVDHQNTEIDELRSVLAELRKKLILAGIQD